MRASRPVLGMSYVTSTICQRGWKAKVHSDRRVQLGGREDKRQLWMADRLAFKSIVCTPGHVPITLKDQVLNTGLQVPDSEPKTRWPENA